jgi:hypothetical protein
MADIMSINKKNEAYSTPSFAVVDVVCEVGFQGSTGNITFGDGADEGWTNFN